jgi:hypothetical protein
MEFPFRSAAVSAFVHATEEESRVLRGLKVLLPEDVEVRRRRAKGHHGNPISVLSATIRKRRFLREFQRSLIAGLRAGEKEKLIEAAVERVGEDCRLYLRFDKQLAYRGELVLTEGGDAIHVRLKIAAYPAKREVAVRLLEEFISSGLGVEPGSSMEPGCSS